jgi:hypothetical protein
VSLVLTALLLAPLTVSATGAAAEQPRAEPVRVDIQAPSDCADGILFLDEVRSRTPLVRAAVEGEPARVFRVTVTRDGAVARGTLVVQEGDHASTPRRVLGASCEEVVQALALVAALAVDPLASMVPRLQGEKPATPGTTAPPALSPAVPSTAAPPALPVAAPRPNDSRIADESRQPQTTRRAAPPERPRAGAIGSTKPSRGAVGARRWAWTAGALFDVIGAEDIPVVGASVFGQLEWQDETVLSPSVRLGAAGFGGRSIPKGPGDGRFEWWTGQLDVCPVRALLSEGIVARPCVAAETGVLAARGGGVPNAQSPLVPWTSVGGLALLEWRFSPLFTLEAYGGVRAPVTRQTFLFSPGFAVYKVPWAFLVAGTGVGLHFP